MGYVYKYTHPITGKWYIGSHNGKKKNYTGSGLIWQRAKKKYGVHSFIKEILYEGDDYQLEEEKLLKQLDAANDPLSYNKKNEALGGTFFGENNGMFGKKLDSNQRHKCGNAFRGKSRPDHAKLMSGAGNPMYGKTNHSYGLVSRAIENKGKTYEEIFGTEKAAELKKSFSENRKGKSHNLRVVVCPHCNKSGSGPNMTRYHFDNCRVK